MNIRHRITVLIALTFVAIFSIGGYSIVQSLHNATEVKSVTEGVVPSALASSDLVSQLKDVQQAVVTVVTSPDEKLAAQSVEKLVAKKKQLQQSIELQGKQASDDKQRGLVKEAQESMANYFGAIEETTNFKMTGQKELAEASLIASVAQYQLELEGIVATLRIEKNRSKDSAIEALNKSLSNTVNIVSLVTLLTIVVLSIFGVVLYRQITRPISKMQMMMSEIATSQDFTRRVPVERQDEIGRSILAFNSMIEKIQESSGLLKQKTTDIETMLQNMPQGILTIAGNNQVHAEYSAYLETIFETADIAGRDMMDLVFSHTNLGADTLSQVEAVGGACIGEDLMNFEFNQHLMVGQIEKTMPDGRVKILELNWSPITDGADTTIRLLLCVRDVTELRKLAAEANEKKRELEIIGEILAVRPEKFHEFIASAIKFIDENELIIRKHVTRNDEALAQLFRNMHTVKGNARTYGLHHLTNEIHEAEHSYQELRKPLPDIAWDQNVLLNELAGVRAWVESYASINDVSLGRKGQGRRGDVERYLMVDKQAIQDTIQRLATVNPNNIQELVAARDAAHKALNLLGTEPIGEALDAVLESLPSLANELGKLPPMIEIVDNGYVVVSQSASTLKNVFMHLMRNSIDHGLEIPAWRLEQDKPASGKITLRLEAVGEMLHIGLSDDGRGLAMARIRELAV
ncbi:MAG TPA: HAMP domain-containing protein, partial [Methylophilaceae bacterium]